MVGWSEYHGTVQPMRLPHASISADGARGLVAFHGQWVLRERFEFAG